MKATGSTTGDIEHTSKYGESALFYVLRAENWEFLRKYIAATPTTKISISNEDYATHNLLINR